MSRRVVVVIQARMGSTRLPGKVLTDIAGRSMLDRVVTRVRAAERVDDVVVATSTLDQDDAIVAAGAELATEVVRGDPLDVLSRYALAATASSADVVVRVTSDCPFIDPTLVSTVVAALVDAPEAVDYAANTLEPRHFPRGLDCEVMTAEVLAEADRVDDDPGTREHVTPFIRDSGRYRLVAVSQDEDLSDIRWTVDTPEDLEMARLMAGHFGGAVDTPWPDLLEAWRAHPAWRELNAMIEQKAVIRTRPLPPA